MSPEQVAEGVSKGLEAWTLQNLIDLGMLLSFLALGLMTSRAYLESFKKRMTLRLSVEIWDILMDLGTDALLLGAALLGLLTTNPDIMVDVKIALPWLPLANLLMGIALVLRAFHGGHTLRSWAWWGALALVATACLLNWFGFTFVMEGATDEYFPKHFPAFWNQLHAMRSDMNRELSLTTFYYLSPAFALLFAWAAGSGLRETLAATETESKTSDAS
jgi:hypothetical protein